MTQGQEMTDIVDVVRPQGGSQIVLVCEHASCFIPPRFAGLGLDKTARHSHAAWDPGAIEVARAMSEGLDATLVASRVSRLVYDCNRPPEAPDAVPAKSEIFDVPGNAGLTADQRRLRAELFYHPFREMLARQVAAKANPVLVTIHSFTPVYHGQRRDTEIGILHDADTRLADAFLDTAPDHTARRVGRNMPYGPEDGVTHTLKQHALPHGHLNVMIELRNDLIATQAAQRDMADCLTHWTHDAIARTGAAACRA